jgi:hypothetical protein
LVQDPNIWKRPDLVSTRKYLFAFFFAALSLSVAGKVFADDHGGNSGSGGESSHSGENQGGGNGGSHNSGDDGGGDNDNDEGGHSGGSGGGGGGTTTTSTSNSGQSITQNQVRDAVQAGKAVSLPLVLAYMDNYYKGQVLDIKLRESLFGYYYDVKYLDASNRLLNVALDAQTLKKR